MSKLLLAQSQAHTLRALAIVCLLVTACATTATATPSALPPGPTPTITTPLPNATPSPAVTLNPASANCLTQGGQLQSVAVEGELMSVCVFVDGSLCEERALLEGVCRPGQFLPFTVSLEPGLDNRADQFCLENGGQLALLRLSTGAEFGLCLWPSGKFCEQGAVLGGECGP